MMTLRELIVHLEGLASEPGLADLPVYLADWSEEYAADEPLVHERIAIEGAVPEFDRRSAHRARPRRVRLG